MQTSTSSLRSLPPKQALVLALMEKARREKLKSQRLAVEQSSIPPQFLEVPSLVLNREHPLSDLYYKKARYKIYWGGRGSAKSWGVAEALIRLTSAQNLRVLCTREYQTSIKDSSHKILKDTIERLGMQSWFHITQDSIRSRSGAEFLFKGLHGNEQGIRSTEGVDICWCEEAQTITAASWRSLTPTIRKPGSEIWVTYNLVHEEDATHQRFVIKQRRDSIVHNLNYDSNPYFGGVLKEEMEEDRETDLDLYNHVWLGLPLKVSNSVIFSGKCRVEAFDDELWRQAERIHLGADFGFAQDPATLMRCFILESDHPTLERKSRKLYVSHEAYAKGVELDDMPSFYDSVPGSREWPIKADSARPETISHLRRKGFAISAAEKWDGSVKDGITHLRGFDEIVIHSRCTELQKEAYMYRYKVDKNQVDERGQPQVLPIPVDKHNHCWDGIRYSLDGYIQRGGIIGLWERLGDGT